MTHTALTLLPHVLRAALNRIPGGHVGADACYQTESDPPGAVTARYAGLYDFQGDPIIETDMVGHPAHAKDYLYHLQGLAAAFNALPGLIELAEDWRSWEAIYPDGHQAAIAQRICDAIRTAAPDVYAQAVAAMEARDA